MYFNANASGYKKIDNFFTTEILPFGQANIGNQQNPFENGFFNNLILSNVSSNNVILSNLTSENLRFTNGTGNNLIINNTINSNTISTGNLFVNNETTNNLRVNNTINSNTISAGNLFSNNETTNNLRVNNTINSNTISAGNIFATNQTANLLHINNRINLSNTQQSIAQIPVFIEPNNDVNFLVVSAGGGGAFSTKRSGIILGRARNDLASYRIENNSNGNLEIHSGIGNSVNLYHNTSGSNIFNINSSRLSTGNIQNTNTTLQNLRASNITTENIDITRGGVNLLTFNFATGSNLKMNNNIETISISSTNGNINNLTTSNLFSTNISSTNISASNISSSNLSSLVISSSNLQCVNSTINSLRFNNINTPLIYSSGNLSLDIDNNSIVLDDGKLEIGNIGTYLRGIKGVQSLNATLMLEEINDYFGFTLYDNVEDLTDDLGVKVDAVFLNTYINEDHFKFGFGAGGGGLFPGIPPYPLELKLPSANQICFIRDGKITGDNSLKFNQASQSCTIENLTGQDIDYFKANFTYITSGNIRSTNLLYGPNLYVNNLHSCANATMTNLKVNNVLTFDSIQGDLISTKNMLLVNITCSNIKANNKITSDVLDSAVISAGSILTNHITSSNLRINTTASINNLQCEVAFIGGMSVGNATMNNLRILQGMTCESIRANDTISSLCLSSANLFNQTATLGNVYFDNINQNPFGYSTFSNMRILNTLGSNVISCANLWTDNTISSRALSVANFFTVSGTCDNLKVNSVGSIGLISSGNILNDNTVSSSVVSCANLFFNNSTVNNIYFSDINQNPFGHSTFSNMKINSTLSSTLISSGNILNDNTVSSSVISCANLLTNNTTLGSLRINNHATIDNLLATNITITNSVPKISIRDTSPSTDAEVICRGYIKDLNNWMGSELGSNMMLSAGKLKADLVAVPLGGISITDDKNIRIDPLKMTVWDGYNSRISACETGVGASGALIAFLNTSPVPNALFVGAPQYFIFVNTSLVAITASASTALGVGSDALAKVDRILAGTEDLTIPTLTSINVNTTNSSITNLSVSNVRLNGTSLNTIITDTNISINNINSSISSLSFPQNTAPSNFIATTLTTTNLQLNGSSLNTLLTNTFTSISNINSSISSLNTTSPNNLIATNLTTTNAVINSFSRHLKIDGGTTGLPTQTDFHLYLTGNEGSPNVGSLYVGDGSGWGFNFKRRVSSTDTVIGRINDNGNFWMSNEISCGNLRTTNLTTTNLQLNGSSLNTVLTNTFTSINNLSALTSANLSNISSSNICVGSLFSTNLTTLNLAVINTIGLNYPLSIKGIGPSTGNEQGVVCKLISENNWGSVLSIDSSSKTNGKNWWVFSTHDLAGEGAGKLIFRNHSEAQNILTLTSTENVGIRTVNPTQALDVNGNITCSNLFSGNLQSSLISTSNLRVNSITASSLNLSSGSTQLQVLVGNRGSSSVNGWTTLDPNGGSSQGLFIWDGLEVNGNGTISSLRTTNLNTSTLTSGTILMRGASNNVSGPHINIFHDAVNHQSYQLLNWNSDNIAQSFNAYFDGNWKRASGTACHQIYKLNDRLEFNFVGPAGVAGDSISWQNSYAITNTGIVSGASFQLTNLAGLNTTMSNSILNNATINNLMIPSGTNSNITLGNSYITSRISAGTASTFRHIKQSRIVTKASVSIGSLDIEEAEIIFLDPAGVNQNLTLPNNLNIPNGYSCEFILRNIATSAFNITLTTIANGSFIYPSNRTFEIQQDEMVRVLVRKTTGTSCSYYITE